MTTNILRKVVSPFKKAIKWYFTRLSETGNYICMTGTFPPEYYEKYIHRSSVK